MIKFFVADFERLEGLLQDVEAQILVVESALSDVTERPQRPAVWNGEHGGRDVEGNLYEMTDFVPMDWTTSDSHYPVHFLPTVDKEDLANGQIQPMSEEPNADNSRAQSWIDQVAAYWAEFTAKEAAFRASQAAVVAAIDELNSRIAALDSAVGETKAWRQGWF